MVPPRLSLQLELSHLYHLQPALENGRTNFRKYTIELVCEDVRARIRDKLMNKDVNELWNLYISTMERHGTLKGIRYEAYAHKKIIAHGVNVRCSSGWAEAPGSVRDRE